MNVLVTGASGFIGSHFVRTNSNLTVSSIDASVRLSVKTELPDEVVMQLQRNDVVLHLAGLAHRTYSEDVLDVINHQTTLHFALAAAKAGIKRFVFVSTIGVHGSRTLGFPFNENSSYEQCENISKLRAEEGLRKIGLITGMEITIVRPALVYGPNAPGNIAKLLKFIKIFPITPFLIVNNKRSFISIDNLCDFLDVCCSHPNAAGQSFLVADDTSVSTKDFIEAFALAKNKRVFHLPVPVTIIRCLGFFLGRTKLVSSLVDDLEMDCSKSKGLLNWNPSEVMGQAMKKI